ncbi:MAG: hypothetical protein DRI86_05950 [Bacteroidetes bacterium]|nr:MAG: hypothetical protein DRI86_05950 [Bacteroidota bacterium]
MKSKKIIILDDHTLFLKGMELILKEYCPNCDIYTYQSIKKLKHDRLNLRKFDLLVSDIELPDEDTFSFFSLLKENYPRLPILIVSMHKKNAIIKKCKAIGIEGYLLKHEDQQLTKAITTILSGKEYFSKTIVDFCKQTNNINENLSLREEEIIKLIAKGHPNQKIALILTLSVETIKTHKRNIKLKLNLKSTSDIIDFAKNNYLL